MAQLEDLKRRLEVGVVICIHSTAFSGLEQVELVAEPAGCRSNHGSLL